MYFAEGEQCSGRVGEDRGHGYDDSGDGGACPLWRRSVSREGVENVDEPK